MTDIVERLRTPASDDEWMELMAQRIDAAAEIERLKAEVSALNHAEVKLLVQVDEQDAEIERLKVENIQMKAALGYAICAADERHIIPENPFKCGICDANKGIHAEVERLRAALREIAEVGYVSLKDAPAMHDEAVKIARAALKEDGDE